MPLGAAAIAALLTDETLKRIAPTISPAIRKGIRQDAPSAFAKAKIDSVVRIAHFLAQTKKETGGFKTLEENLRYKTIARLRQVWPSRFPTDAAAAPYVDEPEKLANFVYAGRNGNGNAATGDGWRFRGSGLIQLTGRGNFRSVGELIGVGKALVEDPDSVRTPETAIAVAVGYWLARDINEVADAESDAAVDRVTARINPYEGAGGKKDRRAFFHDIMAVLKSVPAADTASASLLDQEGPTEPDAVDLLADRIDETGPTTIGWAAAFTLASGTLPTVYWPTKDENAPDYFHLAHLKTLSEATGNFTLRPEDLDLLIEANAVAIPENVDVIAIGLRGASLGGVHEQINATSVACMNIRPNHSGFRCLMGFYYRKAKRITLFSGSTVPAPKYIKNYYFKKNGMPYTSDIDCNLLPTGHYVFRVGTHAGTISPALRMSDYDDLTVDARVCVWRTSNDLTFGLADPLMEPKAVYDNVHCSYLLNHNAGYEASFSSAGCLTVRGRKESTDQWKSFQAGLSKIGKGKRVDMLLVTGKEAALAAQRREAGADPVALLADLKRLRIGSSGPGVKALQAKLGLSQTGLFSPRTQYALHEWQKQNGQKADAIYSPQLDATTGWQVF